MSRFMNPALERLTPYTPGEQPQGGGFTKLNTNESPFPPSEGVLKALSEAETRKLNLYSDPSLSPVVKALAERFHVEKERVYAGNGSDEVLAMAMYAFGGNGFLFPDITYGFYKVLCSFFGVAYEQIPLDEDFRVRAEDYCENRRAIVIANPNAPTGIFMPLADIEKILQANPDAPVIIDEAYIEFGGESASRLLDRYDNLLVVGTFSKAWNLAGARLGYAVGSKAMIGDMNTLRFSFHPYNINRLTLLAGEAAVKDEAYYRNCRAEIIKNRESTQEALRALGFTHTPSRANFIFARPPKGNAEEIYRKLLEKKVLVRYFPAGRTKEYLRISVGSAEQMQTFLASLKAVMGEENE